MAKCDRNESVSVSFCKEKEDHVPSSLPYMCDVRVRQHEIEEFRPERRKKIQIKNASREWKKKQ